MAQVSHSFRLAGHFGSRVPQPVSRSSAHVETLDGLRGLAACWTLLAHALMLSGSPRLPILSRADLAVDLFMMLSGFLMTHHYIHRRAREPWESAETMRRFWIRRYFRISPLYYLLLVVVLIAGPRYGEMRAATTEVWAWTGTPIERYADTSVQNLMMHLSYLFGFSPEYSFRTALPDWSIGLEMQFYLVFPFLMLLAARVGLVGAAVLAMAAAGALVQAAPGFFDSYALPAALPLSLHMFLFGMALAWGRAEGRIAPAALTIAAVLLISPLNDMTGSAGSAAWLMALFLAVAGTGRPAPAGDPGTGAGPRAARLAARALTPLRRLCSGRIAGFLGDISYGIYLTHLLVILPVTGMLAGSGFWLDQPWPARAAITLALVLPLVLPLSWLLYRHVELPGIRLGQQVLEPRRELAAKAERHGTIPGP
ncbi:MAG: acyltransferase [Defluviimonas sp.]|nr:acyltransferase [Defluviimonas sp.]